MTGMKSNVAVIDPVPALLDELVDGLKLLYECRHRGIVDTDRLLASIEDTMDLIERYRLSPYSDLVLDDMNSEDFVTTTWNEELSFDEAALWERAAQA